MLDSLARVDPTDQAPTHALFGIAAEDAPVANGTIRRARDQDQEEEEEEEEDETKKKKKKKKKKKGKGKKRSD